LFIDPSIIEAINFLCEGNTSIVVKEWSLSNKIKVDRKEFGHLFASIMPKSMREVVMRFFENAFKMISLR
jgi:hypothetical protein